MEPFKLNWVDFLMNGVQISRQPWQISRFRDGSRWFNHTQSLSQANFWWLSLILEGEISGMQIHARWNPRRYKQPWLRAAFEQSSPRVNISLLSHCSHSHLRDIYPVKSWSLRSTNADPRVDNSAECWDNNPDVSPSKYMRYFAVCQALPWQTEPLFSHPWTRRNFQGDLAMEGMDEKWGKLKKSDSDLHSLAGNSANSTGWIFKGVFWRWSGIHEHNSTAATLNCWFHG